MLVKTEKIRRARLQLTGIVSALIKAEVDTASVERIVAEIDGVKHELLDREKNALTHDVREMSVDSILRNAGRIARVHRSHQEPRPLQRLPLDQLPASQQRILRHMGETT